MRHTLNASTFSPPHLLAAAVGAVVVSCSTSALADEKERKARVIELDSQTVSGESSYKVDKSASVKYTEALFDTPQTITVVPSQLIREQNALSLRQALSNVSGITFNAGEGGGGSGDSINIRGFSANSNLQIDGLRDSAQNNRTDMFNLEQVEVIM